MRQILKLSTIGVLGVAIVFFALDSDQADLPVFDIDASAVRMASSLILESDSAVEAVEHTLPFEDIRIVGKGDTLMALLKESGVPATEADRAIRSMAKIYKPKRIKPGQKISIIIQPQLFEPPALLALTFSESAERDIFVRRAGTGFESEAVLRPLQRLETHAAGHIETSLYAAGIGAGISQSTLSKLIHIFSFDVDFQRDIHHGDSFSVFFEEYSDNLGQIVKSGDILMAEMVIRGNPIRLYRYQTRGGQVDYYDAKGRSVRKALLRTPIDGARISSGFGKRRHPILGYTKFHKGLDFAARRGTPIYAAGDGVIEYAGRNGNFGKYVRIRHKGTYKTAYAHMHRYGRAIRKGRRVRQGQVIGYVGSSGRSTGPHLHYEVHKAGRQINPRSVRLPSGRKLKGRELAIFKTHSDDVERRYAVSFHQKQIAKHLD